MKPLVLVVEDEAALQQLLAYNLERAGFAVAQASDAEEALTLIAERPPDLVLLDWMLPWTSGLELCRQLRRKPATANLPIVMLTARTEQPDRLQGLDTGADDYVTKPFSIEELIARVRAVLRRVRPAFAAEVLRFADLTMDLAAHRVVRGARQVHLSPTEFRLLRQLLQSPGRVFSRDQLLDLVWGLDPEVELRTVDATIRRLRRAINAGGEPDLLRTVRATGYAIDHASVARHAVSWHRPVSRRLCGVACFGGRLGHGIAGGAARGDPGGGRVADLVDRFLGRPAEGRAAWQIGHDRDVAVVLVAPEHLQQVLHGMGPYFSIMRASCRA